MRKSKDAVLIIVCFTFPCRIEHLLFALVQRACRLVSLHLRNLHLPSLNPLGLTYHPSFCHSLIPPATLSMSCPLARLFFHLSFSQCCVLPAGPSLCFYLSALTQVSLVIPQPPVSAIPLTSLQLLCPFI